MVNFEDELYCQETVIDRYKVGDCTEYTFLPPNIISLLIPYNHLYNIASARLRQLLNDTKEKIIYTRNFIPKGF